LSRGRLKGENRLTGTILVNRRGVGKNQRMSLIVVLEVIKDPALLHQTGDKVEISLAVLHAEFTRLIVPLQLIREVTGEAAIVEDLCDDIRNTHILENAAISMPCKEPEPRHAFGFIISEPGIGAGLPKAADEAVNIADRVVRLNNRYGHPLP